MSRSPYVARVQSALTLVSALLLGACAVGPSTRVRPDVPSVTARASSGPSADTRQFLDSLRTARAQDGKDSLARITSRLAAESIDLVASGSSAPAWTEVLRDSTLESLIRVAVSNNRNLRVAQQRINEFRALRGVAASRFFPQINVGTTMGTNKIALAAAPPIEFDAARVTSDLAWELDFWGRTRRATQAAGFDVAAREDDVRATTLSLVSDVANTYLQLREADAVITIAEQTLVSREATLQLARRRFEQGLISELDVRQFEATVADPAARVADFTRQRTELENALSVLLGTSPQTITRGQLLSDIVKTVNVPDSLSGDLLARVPMCCGRSMIFRQPPRASVWRRPPGCPRCRSRDSTARSVRRTARSSMAVVRSTRCRPAFRCRCSPVGG